MSDLFTRLRRFLRELKRRNVYKVAATYAVVGFLLIQAADLIFPALNIPSWGYSLVVVLILFGFPIALIVAWAFEMSPEGMRRTPEAGEATAASSSGGVEGWIVVVVILLFAGGGLWYLTAGSGEKPKGEAAGATDTAKTVTGRPDTVGPPRIAVLPFENIAPDSTDDYFARGMHEEVLNQLSKVSGLEVISRTTMVEMADAEMTAAEIGRELDADALLEGTVRRAGDRVRITTQLIDAREDAHLWSNTYKRRLEVDQIFRIQADIAEEVAGALETRLAEGERRRIENAPTSNLAAYDAYLKGRSQFWRFVATRSPDMLDAAIDNLRTAVRRDSTFSEAWGWLAHAQADRASGLEDDAARSRWLDSASNAVDRAQAVDSKPTDALIAQGYIYLLRDSLDAAERVYRRSLELEPNNAHVAGGFSDLALNRGEFAEAVRWAHRAVQLDPRHPWYLWELGFRLSLVGLTDAGEAWFRRTLEVDPDNYNAVASLTGRYLARGAIERARSTVRSFRERNPQHREARVLAAQVALRAGEPGEARAHLKQLAESRREDHGERPTDRPEHSWLELPERAYLGQAEVRLGRRARGRDVLTGVSDSLRLRLDRQAQGGYQPFRTRVFLAGVLSVLGERDDALRQLDRVASENSVWRFFLSDLRGNPLFDNLRSDSRFRKILREIEARQEKLREEVRRMDLDLYPPGAEPDTASVEARADD